MLKRIIWAVAVLQASFLLTALLAFERFYFEVNLVRGLLVLTPALGAGLGGVLAFLLGRPNRKRILGIWVICFVGALPAFGVSNAVGKEVRQARLQWQEAQRLKEPLRLLGELALERGWTLREYDLNPAEAYALYEAAGERHLASVRFDPALRLAGTAGLAELETALAAAAGAPGARLEPSDLFSRRWTLRTPGGSGYAATVIPDHTEKVWRLRCAEAGCPSVREVTLPMEP